MWFLLSSGFIESADSLLEFCFQAHVGYELRPLFARRLHGRCADQHIDRCTCLAHIKCPQMFANSVNTYARVYHGKAFQSSVFLCTQNARHTLVPGLPVNGRHPTFCLWGA